ncbi:MAG: AI-2E family transporter [Patescibacteria group bacterium]
MVIPVNTLSDISYRSIFRVLGVLAVMGFLYVVRDIIALLFVALVFSAAIDPFVDSFAKRQIPRALGILIVYVLVLGIFGITLTLLIPPLVTEVRQLAESFPYYYDKLSMGVNYLRDASGGVASSENVQQIVGSFEKALTTVTAGVFTTISSIFGGVVSFFIILVLTFYMVVDEDGIKRFLQVVTPENAHQGVIALTIKIQDKIGLWLRGQLILMLIIALLTFIGLTLIGVPYALVLALVAGVTEIIPYAGPVIGAIPAIFIAFTVSPSMGLWTVFWYILVQQAENHLIVPKVMQKTTGLNPIIVILAVLIGARLSGILGALLAVPIASAIEVIIHEHFDHKTTV